MKKPAPVKGMKVTFISPEEWPRHAVFIKHSLHKRVDINGLVVKDVIPSPHRRGDFIVTLSKNGRMVRDRWDSKQLGPKPKNHRMQISGFGWCWLKPLPTQCPS